MDVKALPEPFQPGAKLESGTGYSNEQVLLNLWASVFGQEKIGLQDDFFELGGNSLTAVRLLAGVDQLFGTKMPLPLFDKYRTVQDMAGFIKARRATRLPHRNKFHRMPGEKPLMQRKIYPGRMGSFPCKLKVPKLPSSSPPHLFI